MKNVFDPAFEVELYDDDGTMITSPDFMHSVREAEISMAYMREDIPDIAGKKLYDDDGNEVTNPATLRALAEAQQIIRDRRIRWGLAHHA